MPEFIFLVLNVADAYLTRVGLAMGADEFIPWAKFGANIPIRIALVIAILLVLRFSAKGKLLWPINLLFCGVVVWNFMVCVYGHMVFGLPWG
jgi:hypothetical protein